jgi:hypothetical protein
MEKLTDFSGTDFITDHALIRWLERVHAVPMEDLRARLADQVRNWAETGAKRVRKGPVMFVFGPDRRLITVLPAAKRGTKS